MIFMSGLNFLIDSAAVLRIIPRFSALASDFQEEQVGSAYSVMEFALL